MELPSSAESPNNFLEGSNRMCKGGHVKSRVGDDRAFSSMTGCTWGPLSQGETVPGWRMKDEALTLLQRKKQGCRKAQVGDFL